MENALSLVIDIYNWMFQTTINLGSVSISLGGVMVSVLVFYIIMGVVDAIFWGD